MYFSTRVMHGTGQVANEDPCDAHTLHDTVLHCYLLLVTTAVL